MSAASIRVPVLRCPASRRRVFTIGKYEALANEYSKKKFGTTAPLPPHMVEVSTGPQGRCAVLVRLRLSAHRAFSLVDLNSSVCLLGVQDSSSRFRLYLLCLQYQQHGGLDELKHLRLKCYACFILATQIEYWRNRETSEPGAKPEKVYYGNDVDGSAFMDSPADLLGSSSWNMKVRSALLVQGGEGCGGAGQRSARLLKTAGCAGAGSSAAFCPCAHSAALACRAHAFAAVQHTAVAVDMGPGLVLTPPCTLPAPLNSFPNPSLP